MTPTVLVLALCAFGTVAASAANNSSYLVGAIYFGDWHPNNATAKVHGEGWTEYEVVINAQPRYPGHIQPNIPLWLNKSAENTPEGAAMRIEAATDAGIDFFFFDWYWYKEMNPPTGGTFLGSPLEDGFLQAPNLKSSGMQFALMWCTQDWVDIHPAKAGWHGTFRSDPNASNNELLLYDGFMDSATYEAGFAYVVDKYMSLPNYMRIDTPAAGRNADGSVKKCAYFSIYQTNYLVKGTGSVAAAQQVLAKFRALAAANPSVGCVHLNLMGGGLNGIPGSQPAVTLGADSVSNYGWMKTVQTPTFPTANYTDVQQRGVAAWSTSETEYGVPYIPTASVAWDPAPRCVVSDPYVNIGYPWATAWRATPAEWQQSLELARNYLDQRCSAAAATGTSAGESASDVAAYCPPLLLNAWNEWSEGAYLEPDVREGTARLDAVRAVFGKKAV